MNSSYFSIEDPVTFDIEEEKRLEETALDTNKKHKSAEDIISHNQYKIKKITWGMVGEYGNA